MLVQMQMKIQMLIQLVLSEEQSEEREQVSNDRKRAGMNHESS